MNVLSLFTGVGGFDLGLERAGFRIVGQCEADDKCREVLRRHWPGVPLSEDVTTLDGEWLRGIGLSFDGGSGLHGSHQRVTNLEGGQRSGDTVTARDIHLVCGGFPCQDLSVAGKRAGLAGERSGLFHEAARIADIVLRSGGWLLIENVPGLLSSNGGADFGVVLSTLADLGFHDLAWRVLDSRYFGVPQRRRRVFILARRARGDRAKQVLLEPESGGGDFAPGREAREESAASFGQGVAGTLGSKKGGSRYRQDLDSHGAYVPGGSVTDHLANCLQTTAGDYSRADGFNIVNVSDANLPKALTGEILPSLRKAYRAQVREAQAAHGATADSRLKGGPGSGVRRLTPV